MPLHLRARMGGIGPYRTCWRVGPTICGSGKIRRAEAVFGAWDDEGGAALALIHIKRDSIHIEVADADEHRD
jgi:hypothetical protein